jgi:hypothetical protein
MSGLRFANNRMSSRRRNFSSDSTPFGESTRETLALLAPAG